MLAILVVLSVLVAILTGIAFIILMFLLKSASQVGSFMTPVKEGEPSPFASLCQDLAKMVGASVMGSFMGQKSGEARLEKAIQSDMLSDSLANSNPGLSGLLDMFPSLKKRAIKNPGVVQFLMSHMGNLGAPNNAGSNGSSDFAGRLSRYKG